MGIFSIYFIRNEQLYIMILKETFVLVGLNMYGSLFLVPDEQKHLEIEQRKYWLINKYWHQYSLNVRVDWRPQLIFIYLASFYLSHCCQYSYCHCSPKVMNTFDKHRHESPGMQGCSSWRKSNVE